MEKKYIDMKTITSMLVAAAFLFIVYKRRISPILNKGKNKSSDNKTPALQSGAGQSSQSLYPPNVPVIPLAGLTQDINNRYDVMVFDYAECESSTYFAGRIDAKLSLTASQMIDKGYPYRFDFITIGTALLVLVTYRIDSGSNIQTKAASENKT